MCRLLVVVAWILVWPGLAQVQVRHPLPVLWMMPITPQPDQENLTAAVGPAVMLALQDLSRQPPPLGNYEIHFQLLDSQCDGARGLRSLFDAMWAGPKFFMVFGGVCPSVTGLIAPALPALNLVQLSFAVMSPGLDERNPNLFSVAPSGRALNQALVKVLHRYKWNRVAIFTQDRPKLSEMKKDLIKQLMKADVHIAAAESFSENPCKKLKKLKGADTRIIIGQFEEDSASQVFCCASRLNLFGGRYQWIVTSGTRTRGTHQVSGCSADRLLAAEDGTIRLDFRYLSNSNTRGVSGRTPEEYQQVYFSQLVQDGLTPSRLHGFAYDGVWVAAKALSRVMEAVKHRQKYNIRRNVTVTEKEMEKMLLDAMNQIQFEGVTGPVLFRNGERMTWIELSQFQGAGPAKDQVSVRLQPRRVGPVLYWILSSLAVVTIVVTLIIFCFNIRNRKHWLLMATGRPLDELLLLGILLSTSYIPLSGLDGDLVSDRTLHVLCSVRLWFLSVGHSVGFGVLLVKTWQVYSVFTKPGTKEKILDPLRWVESESEVESESKYWRLESEAGGRDGVRSYSERCTSSNMELWLTAVYGYKGPMLGLGCFLAWSIRSRQEVHPASLSKHLVLSVGAVTVSSGLGVLGSLMTSHDPPVQFCLSSLLILSCNTFILLRLFGPKIVYIRANSSEVDQPDAAEEETSSTGVETLTALNQQLRRRTTQRRFNGSDYSVRRRLSVQLPILHHAYLLAVGGVTASCSSLFDVEMPRHPVSMS
ncbi:gamma-aminobutyric acid type B receptor subunit 2-like [Diretmus argenteus]